MPILGFSNRTDRRLSQPQTDLIEGIERQRLVDLQQQLDDLQVIWQELMQKLVADRIQQRIQTVKKTMIVGFIGVGVTFVALVIEAYSKSFFSQK